MENNKNIKKYEKPSGSAKETVEEVTVDSAEETEVVAKEASEDIAKKPVKGKRNGRRRNNRNGNRNNSAGKTVPDKKEDGAASTQKKTVDEHKAARQADTEKPQNRESGKSSEAEEHTESGSHSSSNKALELELEKQREQLEEADDRYKRLLAEFDNARNRYEKESKRMYDVGAKEVLEKLLPVVDNFERALMTIPEEDKERAFEQGVDQIYRQFIRTLDEIGVRPMNAEGTQFDPNLHNAVMHVEDEAFDENMVAEELQKGYMYKEDVLRHSMVKVAN